MANVGTLGRNMARTRNGTALSVVYVPEAASQSFKAGDFVNLSSGKAQAIVAAGNNLGSGDKIFGRAMQDATGTTDNIIQVLLVTPDTEFLLPIYHGTVASAVAAAGQLGTAYELRNDSSLGYCVAIDATSNTKVAVTNFYEPALASSSGTRRTFSGETNGLIWVSVLAAQKQVAV